MTSKRNFGIALSYVFLLFLFIAQARADEFARGVLWEISGAAQGTSHVLGTIHSDDPRVTRIPAEVEQVFNTAQSFTAELDMNMSTMLSAQQSMLFTDGRTLDGVLGQARFRRTVELTAHSGLPEPIIRQMKPWAIAVQLSLPRPQSGLFLDLLLYQQAQGKGLPVHGLETVTEQLSVFDDMPMQKQVIMLDEALDNYKEMPAMIDRLVQLYLQRDLAGLQKYNAQQMQKSDRALADYVENKLLIERNRRMVERMQPRLREGKAFIAVGALHLPGEHGILNLLQEQGYRLKALY